MIPFMFNQIYIICLTELLSPSNKEQKNIVLQHTESNGGGGLHQDWQNIGQD